MPSSSLTSPVICRPHVVRHPGTYSNDLFINYNYYKYQNRWQINNLMSFYRYAVSIVTA